MPANRYVVRAKGLSSWAVWDVDADRAHTTGMRFLDEAEGVAARLNERKTPTDDREV